MDVATAYRPRLRSFANLEMLATLADILRCEYRALIQVGAACTNSRVLAVKFRQTRLYNPFQQARCWHRTGMSEYFSHRTLIMLLYLLWV